MGVDTDAYFPPDIEWEDVQDAIGQLLGIKPKWCPPKDEFKSWGTLFEVKCYDETGGATLLISIPDKLHRFDGAELAPTWHWAAEYHDGKRWHRGVNNLSFCSTPLRVAIMQRLAQIFGGVFTPQDTSAPRNFIYYPRPRAGFSWSQRSERPHWDKWQKYLYSVQPLTDADVDAARKLAAWADAKW